MPDRRLTILGLGLLAACAFFLFWGLKGPAGFILELRATKLAALLLVGAAVGISTVVFQTVTGNRILTPSIMGFDSLFLLVQSLMVLTMGGLGYVMTDGPAKFLLDTGLMMAASLMLFTLLMGRGRGDLHRMILAGVIIGLFFRSMTAFVLRLIDPSEFSVVQQVMFASFGAVDTTQLAIAAVLFLAVFAAIWKLAPALDIVALGRDSAVGLGLRYDRLAMVLLLLVSALVAVSTALVGPISFLGLLVAALAHEVVKTPRHVLLLPAAALIAGLVLVIGQGVFERLLGLQSTLAVIIEFFGGLLFLYLVMGGRRR
ncbi:iron chelate uptake ABC transporter family permease subunit [Poseidonocella sp. HB161398]|uniref:iron chelate uptake ABC transporter family permease subunit n=1 Tax=Poseidonocella sp. HB161398 TaxID=2320855 RepID=UPI00110933B8|nr:iron chelate uptake ABC transporter family permease subunit [Poseidonocella sp. HB161398]